MARTSDDKSKFLEFLRLTPSISFASKKIGVSRTTIYRWRDSNPDFKVALERALNLGRAQWIDNAEAALMKKVQEGHFGAIKFFLTHNDPRYVPIRSSYSEPLSEKERRQFERLLVSSKPMPPDLIESIVLAMKNYGLVKINKKD